MPLATAATLDEASASSSAPRLSACRGILRWSASEAFSAGAGVAAGGGAPGFAGGGAGVAAVAAGGAGAVALAAGGPGAAGFAEGGASGGLVAAGAAGAAAAPVATGIPAAIACSVSMKSRRRAGSWSTERTWRAWSAVIAGAAVSAAQDRPGRAARQRTRESSARRGTNGRRAGAKRAGDRVKSVRFPRTMADRHAATAAVFWPRGYGARYGRRRRAASPLALCFKLRP
jgi:hypothetical protein